MEGIVLTLPPTPTTTELSRPPHLQDLPTFRTKWFPNTTPSRGTRELHSSNGSQQT